MIINDKLKNEPDPFVCARCAAQGPTCCRIQPGQEEYCFPVSEMEWARILDFAGESGAFVQEQNSRPFVDNLRRLFPGEGGLVERMFPSYRHHFRLAVDGQGRCLFLGPDGCSLPRRARPYYCRLYPFWIYGERVSMFDSSACLALREARTPAKVMSLMNISTAEIRRLQGRLRLAWGLPPAEGEPLLKQDFARYRK